MVKSSAQLTQLHITDSSEFQLYVIFNTINTHIISTVAQLGMWTTGSALAAASDIHRQVPTNMAGVRRDWLTNQNTD